MKKKKKKKKRKLKEYNANAVFWCLTVSLIQLHEYF